MFKLLVDSMNKNVISKLNKQKNLAFETKIYVPAEF